MHIIISPAKALDFDTPTPQVQTTQIRFAKQSKEIVKELKQLKPDELSSLLKISNSLTSLNYHRYQLWSFPFKADDEKAALFAFKGDVYTGIDAYSLTDQEIEFASKKLRILSGLYGLLRPLDAIMPYRLEMGTKISIGNSKNLYSYWDDAITQLLIADMKNDNSDTLINLASNEYFKAINKRILKSRVVTPVFKDWKNGEYKVISLYAKKARGLMTRFIIQNEITQATDLIAFSEGGYYYKPELSSDDQPVFVRDHEGE